MIAGGPYSDKIFTGDSILANTGGLGPGAAFDVLVYGDMDDTMDFAGLKIPDGGD